MKVGDVQMAQHDPAGALRSYRDGLAILDRLAKSDSGNAGWQRDLSAAYGKVGDVQMAQSDLAGALRSYRDDLAIMERLAKSDSGNAGWQRDLALAYGKVGDVQMAQSDLAGALASYRDRLAIMERLAKSDPGNAGWQRDLAYTYGKLGDVLVAQKRLRRRVQGLSRRPRNRQAAHHTRSHERAVAAYPAIRHQQDGRSGLPFRPGRKFLRRARSRRPGHRACTRRYLALYEPRPFADVPRPGRRSACDLFAISPPEERRWKKLRKDLILEDFAELRKVGLSDPLMEAIEKLFKAAT